MKIMANILIICIITVTFAGCASSPTSRFYTLSSTVPTVAVEKASVSVSVGPVSVPGSVDRPQIVLRTGANQVSISEFDRWASPLKSDITRIIVEDLILILGTPYVTVFPQSAAAEEAYRVKIDILNLESELGKAAKLDALWTVYYRKDGSSQKGRAVITEPTKGEGYPELVAAHSRALGQLSYEIAEAIRGLEARNP